jgi:hypothetical protein
MDLPQLCPVSDSPKDWLHIPPRHDPGTVVVPSSYELFQSLTVPRLDGVEPANRQQVILQMQMQLYSVVFQCGRCLTQFSPLSPALKCQRIPVDIALQLGHNAQL